MSKNNDKVLAALETLSVQVEGMRKDTTEIMLRLALIEGYIASLNSVRVLREAARDKPKG